MVNAAIHAAVVGIVGVFSGAWIYQWKEKSVGATVNETSIEPESTVIWPIQTTIVENPTWSEVYDNAISTKLPPIDPTVSPKIGNNVTSPSDSPYATDLETLIKTGKWLVFMYADWCPHSRAYFKVWQELNSRLASQPAVYHPKLAAASIGKYPALAALLKLEKLPSFMLVMDGYIRGQAIASPTLDQLYDVCNSNWFDLTQPKTMRGRPSEIVVFSMKAFDWLGRLAFDSQDRLLAWITAHMYLTYSLLTIILIAGYYFRINGRLLKYL